MFPTPIARATPLQRAMYEWLLPVALVIWLMPLIGLAVTFIRPAADLAAGNYFGWPSSFAGFENFATVLSSSHLARFIFNSFLISVATVIGAVGLACLSGFALAVFTFRASRLVYWMFVAGTVLPFQILLVPVRDLVSIMALYDSIAGLVLFHIAFQSGFCTLVMHHFIRSLPLELIESARMEGVGEWDIFKHIVLPLLRPAIVALSVLVFTFTWNDSFWATVLVQGPQAMPVTAGLRTLNAQWVADWHLMSAASILAALPPVLLFFLMQKHIIAGLAPAATRG